MVKTYQAYMFPKYVKDWLGPPLTMSKNGEWFMLHGSNRSLKAKAETAHDARRVFREMAFFHQDLHDRRVTRHQDKL